MKLPQLGVEKPHYVHVVWCEGIAPNFWSVSI